MQKGTGGSARMYRDRQDTAHAIVEFRAAIAKNDRLFTAYFDLADLLLSRGDTEDTDRLFRRVVRSAPDDELCCTRRAPSRCKSILAK